jgi:hypothetical protein
MLFLCLALYLKSSLALLSSTENRISTRNITCLQGVAPTTDFLTNCEACLATSRNYAIETALSLTGAGPEGISYACLQVNDVEGYHENLVRECRYFPRDTLNGYDDFCIASPYSFIRGSYRACICITNICNLDYAQCLRQTIPYVEGKSPLFSNTVDELIDRVRCYHSYGNENQPTYSSLTPLCADGDQECNNYLFDHGVLCAISVDRTNQITRQTLVPSIYSAYLIKYKTQLCNSFTSTSASIYFSQCQLQDTVCMCALDGCDKDLETCRTSRGICQHYYLVSFFLVFVLNIWI